MPVCPGKVEVRHLCTEKYGVAPELTVERRPIDPWREEGGSSRAGAGPAVQDGVICAPGPLRSALRELLNGAVAMIRRFGIDTDLAPPVTVRVGGSDGAVGVRISDTGGGLPEGLAPDALFTFFHTTEPYVEPTYTFSGNFGGELSGQGVGLPLARVYAELHGGGVASLSVPGAGADAYLTVARSPVL